MKGKGDRGKKKQLNDSLIPDSTQWQLRNLENIGSTSCGAGCLADEREGS